MIICIFTGVHVPSSESEYIGNHKVAMFIQNVFPLSKKIKNISVQYAI